MIQQNVIKEIYRKYRRVPKRKDDLHLHILTDVLGGLVVVRLEGGEVVIISKNPDTHDIRIDISRIHGVIEFDFHVAIVLQGSIIFIAKETGEIRMHIKEDKLTLLDRIRIFLGK